MELIIIPSTLGGLSPLITLKILEKLTDGDVKFESIMATARNWKGCIPWLILAAVSFPIMSVIANALSFAAGLESEFIILVPSIVEEIGVILLFVIPIHFSASLITSPLFEEPAWRGFALVNLQGKYGREIGSLIIGSYWWLWHQMMNISFGIEPSILGYVTMIAQSFMIDSLFNLSRRNILTAMFAHQALGTTFTFFYNSNRNWVLTAIVWIFVIVLRIAESKRGQVSSGQTEPPQIMEE